MKDNMDVAMIKRDTTMNVNIINQNFDNNLIIKNEADEYAR